MSAGLRATFSALRAASSFSENDTLLPLEIVRNGSELAGDDDLLSCFRRRLHSKRQVTVAALGGSISAGSSYGVRYGGTGAWLYHAKVTQALQAVFPPSDGSKHVHHNGALPATGPAFFEHCVEGQLPLHRPTADRRASLGGIPLSAPPLVLVEFGVNTDGDPAAFERMLRKLLEIRPVLAVVVVNTHVWTLKGRYRTCWKGPTRSGHTMLEPEQRAEQTWTDRFNYGDEDAIAALCHHYDVPLVSMRSAMLEPVRQGTNPIIALRHFMIDCKHPSGQGHSYLAQLVLHRLLRGPPQGTGGVAASLLGGLSLKSSRAEATCAAAVARAERRVLSPPLHPTGWQRGVSRCVNGEPMRHLKAISPHGFSFTDEGRGKYGWVGLRPGDELSFCAFDRVALSRRKTHSAPSTASLASPFNGRCADGLGHIPRPGGGRGRATREERLQHCQAHRSMCGSIKMPKLVQQCPLSCGMCLPSGELARRGRPASDGAPKSPPSTGEEGGTQAGLWIGYLQSYSHMGRAVVSCSGSCSCPESEIDAHAPPEKDRPRTSVTAVRRIALLLSGSRSDRDAGVVHPAAARNELEQRSCCQLRIRILNESSSGEHKFKLLALLVAEAEAKDNWQPPGTKMNAGSTLSMMHHDEAMDKSVDPRPRGRLG